MKNNKNNTKQNTERIMFFSAHPDDEIAGAGGTMLKNIREGGMVKLVLCVNPAEPRFDTEPEKEKNQRLSEFDTVAKKLGATTSFLDFPNYPTLSYQTILPCVKEIRSFKPSIVIILQEDEYHTEHTRVAQIVKRAVWHAGRNAFPECGKPFAISELWEAEGDRPMQNPNVCLDISAFAVKKQELICMYGSQQKRKDLARACLGLNAFRGIMYRKGKFAEAFKTTKLFYG